MNDSPPGGRGVESAQDGLDRLGERRDGDEPFRST